MSCLGLAAVIYMLLTELTRRLVARRVQIREACIVFLISSISSASHPPLLEDNAMSEYHPLPAQRLAGAVRVARPTPPKSVTLMSPALDVMTDLRTIEAGTTEPNETMECANTHMMERGIRSLLGAKPGQDSGGHDYRDRYSR